MVNGHSLKQVYVLNHLDALITADIRLTKEVKCRTTQIKAELHM